MSAIEQALEMHEKWNGKIETTAKSHVNSREDLAIAYTPGVAEPCKVIAKDPDAAYKYTMKANTIAVVSDGSAVLGLGNIGAKAAMPVMEGKAVLFKEFGGVNAVPICLDTQDTEEIIKLAAGRFNKKLRMWCDSAEPDRIKMWQKAGYRAKGVNKETNSVHAQIDYLKQHRIHIHPSCVNTIKEIQQWKWKKDERTNTYLEEPVPFFDDAMAMLRYSIEEERKAKPKLNRNLKGGL